MISEKGLERMQLFPERTLLLVTRSGILRHSIPVAILEKSATINQDLKAIMPYFPNLEEYLYICIKGMESRLIMEYTKAGATVENINFDAFKKILLPVPPKNQITKVIYAANEAEKIISQLELNQSGLIETISSLKSKILDLAIRGKLVPQNPEDEPASVLLEHIRTEKEEQIKAGKIKRDKKESVIFKGDDNSYYEKVENNIKNIADKIPFEIPENWHWERLGNICTISRGGSPRPITDYLTTKSTGINWIKIGDAEQGGKYIYSTKEKIIPEGLPKTRYVKSGDFLLTNSMSFGRPYILKTDGCIHDGWLVIGDIDNVFNQDFLYYALSSSFMYNSFREIAAGSTVKNLKSDTVRSVLFPVPPLKEQERISKYLENLYLVVSTIEQCLN